MSRSAPAAPGSTTSRAPGSTTAWRCWRWSPSPRAPSLVQRGARRLGAARGRRGLLDARRHLLERRVRRQPALPVGTPMRSTSPSTRRPTWRSSCSSATGSRASTRASGSTGSPRSSPLPRSVRPCCSRSSSRRTRGSCSAEAVNLAYPLGRHRPPRARRRGLRDRELAPGAGVGADRRRARPVRARRRRSTSTSPPSVRISSGTILDALWPAALLLLAFAAWSSPDRRQRRQARGQAARRRAGRLRPRRARGARRQLLPAPERRRRRARGGRDRRP